MGGKSLKFMQILFNGLNSAMVPTPLLTSNNKGILYFSVLDKNNKGQIYSCMFSIINRRIFIDSAIKLVLQKGKQGDFDQDGVLPCSIIYSNQRFWLYYIGFKLSSDPSSPYEIKTGVACSNTPDGNFKRVNNQPIVINFAENLLFCTAPHCSVVSENHFELLLTAGYEWEYRNSKAYPKYRLAKASSSDETFSNATFEYQQFYDASGVAYPDTTGIGRPWILENINGLTTKICFSKREFDNYDLYTAKFSGNSSWVEEGVFEINNRRLATIEKINEKMKCFASFITIDKNDFIFYNGNGYGKTGIIFQPVN